MGQGVVIHEVWGALALLGGAAVVCRRRWRWSYRHLRRKQSIREAMRRECAWWAHSWVWDGIYFQVGASLPLVAWRPESGGCCFLYRTPGKRYFAVHQHPTGAISFTPIEKDRVLPLLEKRLDAEKFRLIAWLYFDKEVPNA